ncbi:MAG: acyl carrier protein [bacterium]|nr:acyl carrier protein [bacterium]
MQEQELKQLFASVLGVDVADIGTATAMETVAVWDSLRHLSLVTTIEQRYGVVFTDAEIIAMVSYPIVWATLAQRAATSASE